MLAVFLVAGMALSAGLAYAGLLRGELKFSKAKTLTGSSARTAGPFCLTIAVVLLAATVWPVVMMMRGG